MSIIEGEQGGDLAMWKSLAVREAGEGGLGVCPK